MSFTGKSFKKHGKGLTSTQATKAAKVANAAQEHGASEGKAIAIANKAAAKDKSTHDPIKEGYEKV